MLFHPELLYVTASEAQMYFYHMYVDVPVQSHVSTFAYVPRLWNYKKRHKRAQLVAEECMELFISENPPGPLS